MWIAGITIFLLVFKTSAYSNNSRINDEVLKTEDTNNRVRENDAYVFVTVDNRYLLTRFVASMDEAITRSMTDSIVPKQKPAVEKVSKHPGKKPEKDPDFTIKKTPGV